MNTEELAQALADHFHPPRMVTRHKTPHREARKLPFEERFETVEDRHGPDCEPYITFTAGDGYPSFRAATYREIAEAVLSILKEGK